MLGTVATRTRRQEKATAAKWNQPLSVILNILMYADPKTVRVLCCVSKQFLDIIRYSPAMKDHRVIPLLQISTSESEEDDGRLERLTVPSCSNTVPSNSSVSRNSVILPIPRKQ